MYFLFIFFRLAESEDNSCRVIISGGEKRDVIVTDGKRQLRRNLLNPDSPSAATVTLKNKTDHIMNNTMIDADQTFFSNIPSERSGHKLILFHYQPMLIGGKISYSQRLLTLSETYIFNQTTNDWTLTAPMKLPVRRYHSAEIFRNGPYSGTAWVCGGEYYDLNKRSKQYELLVTNECECYNNYRLRWLSGPTMLEPRKRAASAASFNDIYMIGGVNKNGYLRTVEFIEPAVKGEWQKGPTLPYAVADAAAVSVHDDVFVFGGTNGIETFNKVLRLEDADWHIYGSMLRRRNGLTASLIRASVFLYGGEVDNQSNESADISPEIYNIPDRQSQFVKLKGYTPLKHHSAVAVGDCALEGYLNSVCIISVVTMTLVLCTFLFSMIIYIGWYREDLWHEKLGKYNYHQTLKQARLDILT